jgi:ketosteroid isomerase-like protein
MTIETIQALEQRLLDATFASDLATLNGLLADDLVFITHTGTIADKRTELEAHRSGLLKLDELRSTDEQVRLFGDCALVNLKWSLTGSFDGEAFAGTFRYTRVWARRGNAWQVVSIHVSQVF